LFALRTYSMMSLCLLLLLIYGNAAGAVGTVHPLAPPDTSSPRATLETFLDNMNDAVHAFKAGRRQKAVALADRAARCLDLEKEPPALRYALGFYTVLYLKETLDRIEIPPYEDIPDAKAVRAEKISGWTIPFTEITIESVKGESPGPRFLFSADTVKNAENYYEKVKGLPYKPQSGHGALLNQLKAGGSLLFPKTLLDRFPRWFRIQIHGEEAWQWIGLVLYSCIGVVVILFFHKWGSQALGVVDGRFSSRLSHTIGGLLLPVTLIIFSKVGLWFMVHGLRFLDAGTYVPIALVFLVISYAASIWLIGAILNRIAMVFVAVSGFAQGGVDDQLIRMGFQIVTVVIIGVMTLDLGARLGLPTYSLITGLGIGGIAVALAGREALSNIIGTIMIILDRPFKLGDYIVLGGGERGEVTEVGLRSTRIRTRDDILISIPNSVIANAKMINESAPISMSRIGIGVGVAYGSDLDEVERVLIGIAAQNETVLSDPPPRVRFRRFGDSSLDIELLCWIDSPADRGRTIHELNWKINEEFQNRGIEIPFPQRDIHIRSGSAGSQSGSLAEAPEKTKFSGA
jgi:MscS family membrane protein